MPGCPAARAPQAAALIVCGLAEFMASPPSLVIVTLHQQLVSLVFIAGVLSCGQAALPRRESWQRLLTLLAALAAGLRWSGEMFAPGRWWTLADLAENLLLATALIALAHQHRPSPAHDAQ